MLVGGITFYKTFALYEEKQEFNVLEGRIPDFKKDPENLIGYLESLNETSELAYDGTEDNNLRYIGANPNNYITFNNELWRIIGIMNNIEDSEGNKSSHIKIIRNASIGNYFWSGNSSNDKNIWSESTLQAYLNGEYYEDLTEEAKNMISIVAWNIGRHTTNGALASAFYKAERSTNVSSGNATTWTGKIALMYPSDYGFAVGESVRSACLERINIMNYSASCASNDWLYLNEKQWTMTTYVNNYAYRLDNYGNINYIRVNSESFVIRPTLYLDTNVFIESGTGSSTDPYILKLNNE